MRANLPLKSLMAQLEFGVMARTDKQLQRPHVEFEGKYADEIENTHRSPQGIIQGRIHPEDKNF